VLTVGAAVSQRLQAAGQEIDQRIESAGLTALASLAPLMALAGCDRAWDSMRLFLGVLAGVAICGSLLVLLPRMARRFVASILVLFHFGGILVAVTSVAPRDQPAPWISVQLWTRVYRPYLTFMYLTNAYHFYSPDPGPPSLLWFRIHYKDGTSRWLRLPVRGEAPVALQYQRMLAMADNAHNPMPRPPLTNAEKAEFERRAGVPYLHETWERILERRKQGEKLYSPPIPLPPDMPFNLQYSEPQDYTKRIIASYARHVAREEDRPVKDVQLYLVTHRVISPAEIASGFSPLTETLYTPTYLGKFDPEGNLLDPEDPLLYWYLPISAVGPGWKPGGDEPLLANRPYHAGDSVFNALKIHAGEPQEALVPGPHSRQP
jgi:hypothetical protein